MYFLPSFHNTVYQPLYRGYRLCDYTTFGSPMPMRTWSDPNAKYKYGFNGKEKDNETTVDGGDYDFGARIYDSRLGRWLALDNHAFKYPSLTPYNYCNSSVLKIVDPSGKDGKITGSGTAEDPYIISATYAYVEGALTNDMVAGLNSAVEEFNTKKGYSYKNAAGTLVIVKYKLEAKPYKTKEELETAQKSDAYKFKDENDNEHSSFNTVEQLSTSTEPAAIGSSVGNNKIGFVTSKVNDLLATAQKCVNQNNTPDCQIVDLSQTFTNATIHEIFHNLGGEHTDLVNGKQPLEMSETLEVICQDNTPVVNGCGYTLQQTVITPTKAGAEDLVKKSKNEKSDGLSPGLYKAKKL